jgi:hypothetical protein
MSSRRVLRTRGSPNVRKSRGRIRSFGHLLAYDASRPRIMQIILSSGYREGPTNNSKPWFGTPSADSYFRHRYQWQVCHRKSEDATALFEVTPVGAIVIVIFIYIAIGGVYRYSTS